MTKPIVLAELERRDYRGMTLHDQPCCVISHTERDALCAALRELAREVDVCSAGGDVGRNILARHGIVLEKP